MLEIYTYYYNNHKPILDKMYSSECPYNGIIPLYGESKMKISKKIS